MNYLIKVTSCSLAVLMLTSCATYNEMDERIKASQLGQHYSKDIVLSFAD
jgi:hypothetical protein